ncbi:MAG: DinB family protein [Pyrinomonadaceae bacterium]
MDPTRHVLESAKGVATEIGFSLSAMEEVRQQLREAVAEMSAEEIARRAVAGAHSIGALVLHIGEAEWWWMQCILSGHKLTLDDRRKPFWDVLKNSEKFARLNFNASDCLRTIDEIREQTRQTLSPFDERDFDRPFSFNLRGTQYEYSLRWILHHLVDHEAQHKGQILMLKRLLEESRES